MSDQHHCGINGPHSAHTWQAGGTVGVDYHCPGVGRGFAERLAEQSRKDAPATPPSGHAETTEPLAEGQGMGGLDLDAIEARSAAATPGPFGWRVNAAGDVWADRDAAGWDAFFVASTLRAGDDEVFKDAEFIAHARTDVPALVAEVRRLTAENERLRDAVAKVRELHVRDGCPDKGNAGHQGCGQWCRQCEHDYPCLTIRALREAGSECQPQHPMGCSPNHYCEHTE